MIRSKKAVKFDSKRAEWCTYSNIDEMFTEIYNSMVEAGIPVKHDEKLRRNADEDVLVHTEVEALGVKSSLNSFILIYCCL